MHHKQIFHCQLFSVFNEVAGVVILTGNSVIDVIFCHSIINGSVWLLLMPWHHLWQCLATSG